MQGETICIPPRREIKGEILLPAATLERLRVSTPQKPNGVTTVSKITGLDKMSYKELVSLQSRVAEAIADKQANEKQELKRKLAELAGQSGFDVSELFGGRGGRKGSKVAVKYRNPKNPDETWTGRGRKPNWLSAALSKGQKLDSFLVD